MFSLLISLMCQLLLLLSFVIYFTIIFLSQFDYLSRLSTICQSVGLLLKLFELNWGQGCDVEGIYLFIFLMDL